MENKENFEGEGGTSVDFEVPPQYKVIILNDDYTTMEFVVEILVTVFRKTVEEAEAVMMSVHRNGRGIAGIYPFDIAATRVRQTLTKAKSAGFPLQVIMEMD